MINLDNYSLVEDDENIVENDTIIYCVYGSSSRCSDTCTNLLSAKRLNYFNETLPPKPTPCTTILRSTVFKPVTFTTNVCSITTLPTSGSLYAGSVPVQTAVTAFTFPLLIIASFIWTLYFVMHLWITCHIHINLSFNVTTVKGNCTCLCCWSIFCNSTSHISWCITVYRVTSIGCS